MENHSDEAIDKLLDKHKIIKYRDYFIKVIKDYRSLLLPELEKAKAEISVLKQKVEDYREASVKIKEAVKKHFPDMVILSTVFIDKKISGLQAEIASLRAEGWIDVKERLPEEDERVLVRIKSPICEAGRFAVNSWSGYTDQNKNWFKSRFTHWQRFTKPD